MVRDEQFQRKTKLFIEEENTTKSFADVEVDEFGCIVERKNEEDALEEDDEEDETPPTLTSKKPAGRGGASTARGGRGGRGRGKAK